MSIAPVTSSTILMANQSIERYFIYDFEKGIMKAHFGSAEHHRIKINVHKNIAVDDEMRALLQAYSDQEDTYHREKDWNYVRGVFAVYYDIIKAEAEEEIRLAQLDSSGTVIASHIRAFCAPESIDSYQIPEGYEHFKKKPGFIELQCSEICRDRIGKGLAGGGIDVYPFNYGAICRKIGDTKGHLEMFCLANEQCRERKCRITLNLQIPMKQSKISAKERINPTYHKTDEELAEDHLKERHWTEVLRYK